MKKSVTDGAVVAAAVPAVVDPGDGRTMVIFDPYSADSCCYKVEVRN